MAVKVSPSEKQTVSVWQRLQHTGGMLRQRRVPQVLQMSTMECGAACLAMILRYYGREVSIAEIRERCGVGRDGLSVRDLVRAAQGYGLRARAISLQKNDFRFVQLPAILHWEFDHFLVLERWSPGSAVVVNPATGRMRLNAEEFGQSFTGVVLLVEPGVHFVKGRAAIRMNARAYVMSCIRQAPWVLGQILLASLVLQALGLGVPLLTKVSVDRILPLHNHSILLLLGFGVAILFVAQLVTALLRGMLLVYLQTRVDMYMMLNFCEHLLMLPLRFFHVHASGDILARLSSNSVIRDTLSTQLVSTILDGSFVLVYLCILLWQSWVIGLLALGIGLVQALLVLTSSRALHNLSMRELIAQGHAQSYINEALGNIVSLKAAGAEQRAFQHWSNLFFTQLNASVRRSMLSAGLDASATLLQGFAPLVLLWVGVELVLQGSMQIGTMLALNALAIAFLTPLASLASSSQRLQLVRSHLERLTDVLDNAPEQDRQATREPGKLTGDIVIKGVSFCYDPQSANVLHDIDLHIKAGQKIAIVGHTGSGKSTLGKLLLGLYLPTQGEIFYDEQSLKQLNYQTVRAQFGVVMQEASVFNGSIRQNIAFNDPDMPMEQVQQAAELAALHQDILRMPMGYETLVAEQGNALSGGQRQRLALARALAHSPALLLLDEATSALDTVTEHVVEENLSKLACTQIIIAHRLSTIQHADHILVLEAGRIVEQGTHQALLKRQGQYARLIHHQRTHEEETG